MIAIIQFKSLPGRRFKVLKAAKFTKGGGYACGSQKNYTACAFSEAGCKAPEGSQFCVDDHVYFEEIKE